MLTNQIKAKLNKVSVENIVNQFKDFDNKESCALFNKCIIVAHLHGIDIPSYTYERKDKEGNIVSIETEVVKGYENKLSYSEVAEKVGKSKATCVLYGKTIETLIDNKVLGLFANGEIPFNMNKVRNILDNKDKLIDDKHTLADLMHYSEDSISNMLKAKEGNNNDGDNNDGDDGDNEKRIVTLIDGDNEYKLELTAKEIENLKKKVLVEAEEEAEEE